MSWQPISTFDGDYVCSERLSALSFVKQGVTLRMAQNHDFNQSFAVTEDWQTVRQNRMLACRQLGFAAEQLVVPAQVHGSDVGVVTGKDAGRGAMSPDNAIPGCDALVTDARGLLLGITIADCLPVFLVDPVHQAIGLAHSGWRGTAGQIAVRTLETMQAHFGTRPQDCLAAIGPGIGPEGYEVDQRVYEAFAPKDANAPDVFTSTRAGHWSLDLVALAVHQLQRAGVCAENIDVCTWRTHRDTELFFSHRLVPGCGRMGAFLGLR